MTDHADIAPSQEQTRKRRVRVRLIFGGVLVLLVAALILTPPYVNVNRYRRRITTTMSQSLGRPVHLDNVTLHLLPVPGLTLSNFVVSEDPAFGYEPVIRANTVEATLRVASLWRRQVEFSSIRFIDPSVNLVRNAQGRWNLEDVLMQASHVQTAPTAQRRAGDSPRFPYIEATGARVNVKLRDTKMPFSLTEAQFALWLPSPENWRVRLHGRPTRTDSNVSQTGEMTLEGTLQRAAKMADVPVDIRAAWNDAPLGEASRLLMGADKGWRGTGFAEAHVVGFVSRASLVTHLQLNDLRRADFVPAQPLDVTVDCSSLADVAHATLWNVSCAIPISEARPVTLLAPFVDLEYINSSEAKATVTAVPLTWAFGWAKLFSAEIPASLEPAGSIDGVIDWNSKDKGWQGTVTAKLPAAKAVAAAVATTSAEEAAQFVFALNTVAPTGATTPSPFVRLAPVVLHPSPDATLTLSGQMDADGYALQASGAATPAQVEAIAHSLPPLDQNLAAAFPTTEKAPAVAHAMSVSCVRKWDTQQVCSATTPQAPVKPGRPKRHR